jgi:hypothetical protein
MAPKFFDPQTKYCLDPKDNKPSVSLTFSWIVLIIGIIKFFIAGMVFGSHTMPEFSAGDFGILMTPFLSLYFARKFTATTTSATSDANTVDVVSPKIK